jgi:hypothetical protein
MMLNITHEASLRPGRYYRVVFKFAGERDWLPSIHIFKDKEDAQKKSALKIPTIERMSLRAEPVDREAELNHKACGMFAARTLIASNHAVSRKKKKKGAWEGE